MIEVVCLATLAVLVFANAFYTLWLTKHTAGALTAAQGAMKALERRQDALKVIVDLQHGDIEMARSRHDGHIRRLASKIGDETMVNILTPDGPSEPVDLSEIAKDLLELSKKIDETR